MRVLLDGSLFESAARFYIPVFFWLGVDGRHRIAVRDAGDLRYLVWLRGLPEHERDDWELMLDQCVRVDAKEPSAVEVVVESRRQSSWSASPPSLSVSDALVELTAPYWILVEDGFSDRAFFLALLPRDHRAWLEELERQERVQFEHGGGGGMARQVEALRARSGRRLRTSVLFDSDALQPGRPSRKSDQLLAACADAHAHRLDARSIENYLPLEALRRWSAHPDGRRDRRKLFKAFERLTEEQRMHINMKAGLDGDAERPDRGSDDPFEHLASPHREALKDGFGSDIAKLFERATTVAPSDFNDALPYVRSARAFALEVLQRIR